MWLGGGGLVASPRGKTLWNLLLGNLIFSNTFNFHLHFTCEVLMGLMVHIATCAASVMALVDVCEALSRTSFTGIHIATCAACVMALVDVHEALSWTGLTTVHIVTCTSSVVDSM